MAGLQPLWNGSDKDADVDLSDSDRSAAVPDAGSTVIGGVRSTRSVAGGGWYVEAIVTSNANVQYAFGIANSSADLTAKLGGDANAWVYLGSGVKRNNGSSETYGSSYGNGAVLQLYYDATAGKVWFGLNGTWVGDPSAGTGEAYSGISGDIFLVWGRRGGTAARSITLDTLAGYDFSPPTGGTAGWNANALGDAEITEADDTVDATGTVAWPEIEGTAAITEADDTVAADGVVAVEGSASITEADDTVSGAGEVAVVGSAAITEAGDTVAAEGTVAWPDLSAEAAIEEGDDTVSAEGAVAVSGEASITEADDTLDAFAAKRIFGTAAITEGDDGVSSVGYINPHTGPNRAECDRCGWDCGYDRLRRQMQWSGYTLTWTGLLVCRECLDEPNPADRVTAYVHDDPRPVLNPRPMKEE